LNLKAVVASPKSRDREDGQLRGKNKQQQRKVTGHNHNINHSGEPQKGLEGIKKESKRANTTWVYIQKKRRNSRKGIGLGGLWGRCQAASKRTIECPSSQEGGWYRKEANCHQPGTNYPSRDEADQPTTSQKPCDWKGRELS